MTGKLTHRLHKGRAQLQHAGRQDELAAVLAHIAERLQGEQRAAHRGRAQPRAAGDLGQRHLGVLSRKGADDVQTAREGGDEVGLVFGGGGHRRRLYIWFLSVPPGSITLGTQILKFPVKPVPRLTLGK